jgi:hypothetical protein
MVGRAADQVKCTARRERRRHQASSSTSAGIVFKQLEREDVELRRLASAYFAKAELDRRVK